MPLLYLAMGAVGALGGARPTGIGWLDGALLFGGGVAASACSLRARTVPVYVAAGLAALCQPEGLPLALGVIALVAAFFRQIDRGSAIFGTLAGGLSWAAIVGVPDQPGASPVALPLLGLAWVAWSARRSSSRRFRRRFDRLALALGAVVLVGAGLGALAVVTARVHVDRGADLVESGLTAARRGDTETAVEDLKAARRALARGRSSLGAVWAKPAWLVPGVSQNARALHTIVSEVHALAGAGITGAQDADLAALRASSGRVDLAAVREVREPLAEVLEEMRSARGRLAGLADGWLAEPVANRLSDIRAELDDAIPSAELALDAVTLAPDLLGGDGPRTYLVLFTTPVEARSRTGFPGNYAEVTFRDGRFDMTRFGRISELDSAVLARDRTPAPDVPEDFLARYGRFNADRDWRNITMSPDFPTVASIAAQLYPLSGGRPVDGVMSIDPVALAALLEITGPIVVADAPEPLTSENAAMFLMRDQYVDLEVNVERIDLLESLAEATFERLTDVDLPAPHELGELLGPVVEEGHLQLVSTLDPETALFDRLGLSGRFPAVEGDFVAVTTTNAAMSKIDVFMRRALDYDVMWDPSTGALTATATITVTNEAPADGLPAYLIGNNVGINRINGEDLPDGWNNTIVTLYTPWLPEGATLDGEEVGIERHVELGRQAISFVVPIAPGATRTVQVELAGELLEPRYLLDLAAQPLVEPERASVSLRFAGGGEVVRSGPVERSDGAVSGRFPLVRTTRIVVEVG